MIPHSKPWINEIDRVAVDALLASGLIADGNTVAHFEQAVARYHEAEKAVVCTHGRRALTLLLLSFRLEPGDEIVVPTYACPSLAASVRDAGGVPVPADAGADWCLDPASAQQHFGPRTRAIVTAHIFGIAAPLDTLLTNGPPVIEDCAQSFGARDAIGRLVGTRGAAMFCSFQATKPLTTGQGGLAIQRCEPLDFHAVSTRSALDVHAQAMTDLQACLGLSQLTRYENFLARRRAIAEIYFGELAGVSAELPYIVRDRSIFYRFPLRHGGDFAAVSARFAACGIAVRRGVDALIHRELGLDPQQFPVAERLYRETLSIPIYPAMTDDDIGQVIDSCRHILH